MRSMTSSWNMMDVTAPSKLFTDASAALSIAKKEGAVKMRHINVRSLWLQQKAVKKELEYGKIARSLNPADGLTESVKGELISQYAKTTGLVLKEDRAKSGLKIASFG